MFFHKDQQDLEDKESVSSYKKQYFHELYSEYKALQLKDSDSELKNIADDIITEEMKNPTLSWKDIYTFETIILRLQPEAALRRKAWCLRAKFRDIISATMYEAYLKSNPPDPRRGEEKDLRADLEQILNEFHWQYTVTLTKEKMRRDISFEAAKLFMGSIFFIGLIVVGAVIYGVDFKLLNILIAVPLMGVLGGFISTQIRLQSIQSQGEPLETLIKLEKGRRGVALSPISGAIFAFILFMLFTGDFLTGSTFPKTGTLFIPGYGPAVVIEFAKLVMWSFIAGFAERLVPDVLDRIVATGQKPHQAEIRVDGYKFNPSTTELNKLGGIE